MFSLNKLVMHSCDMLYLCAWNDILRQCKCTDVVEILNSKADIMLANITGNPCQYHIPLMRVALQGLAA
eukprot:c45517_g1_i1 orf=287-493(+)